MNNEVANNILNKNTSYYSILGVDEDVEPKAIKMAYRKLAMKWHPDRFVNATEKESEQATLVMARINKAYGTLMDVDQRKEYDEAGAVDDTVSRYRTKEDSPIFDEIFGDSLREIEQTYVASVPVKLSMGEVLFGSTKTITVINTETGEKAEFTIDTPIGVANNNMLVYFDAVKFQSNERKSHVIVVFTHKKSTKLSLDDDSNLVVKLKELNADMKSITIDGKKIELNNPEVTPKGLKYKGLGANNTLTGTLGDLLVVQA